MAANKVTGGPEAIRHALACLRWCLSSDGKTLACVMNAIYGSALFSLTARNGMGNLIAGTVFFGISTWPYCRRGRKDNLFVQQGLQGRSG